MIDRTGIKYGRWTALHCLGYRKTALYWMCQCECGRKRAINVSNLSGYTSQCIECARAKAKEEAKRRREGRLANCPRAYWIWFRLRSKMIRRWQTFDVFIKDLGPCPDGGCLRRSNRRRYGPSNSYWQLPIDCLPARLAKQLEKKKTRNGAMVEAVLVHHVSQSDLHRRLRISRERVRQIVRKPR